MGKLSDNIRGDKNTLYFIGNGFDLFHKSVKSKFIHFYSWLNLKSEKHEQFASKMERIFPQSGVHGNLLWTDLEESLGNFDIDKVQQDFSGIEKDGFYDEEYQERAANYVHAQFSKLLSYLKEWAKQIKIKKVTPILPIGKESQYLTFNYTLLLEEVYKINPNQILHIHNSIKDDEPLVVGHNKTFSKYFDDVENVNIQNSKEKLAKEIAKIRKPVDEIIEAHKQYFESLGNISKVIVFGHSLSAIDIRYFEEVLYHVCDNAKWVFVVYDENAKLRYQSIVDQYDKYLNDPNNFGVKQYKNKIKPENCDYINIDEIHN